MSKLSTSEILAKIKVPSESDPHKPEFPPNNPHFPATPTIQVTVPGFSNVWLKDESINTYSGTHKDRLAWEVVVLYRDLLIAKQNMQSAEPLSQFSIISSGSAAIAIGRMLRDYDLPKLKVLVDAKINTAIYKAIEDAHCEVFTTDLSKEELGPDKILKLTNNADGFDLTSNKGISLDIGNYDWMSFEILNESPDYVFVPFGSGFVFTKLMEIAKNVVRNPSHDKRYRGDADTLPHCSFIGATTTNPSSIADKLYSPFLPFAQISNDWIRFYKTAGYCGTETGIRVVHEDFLRQAMSIADDQGIACEPSGIAGLAMLLQMAETIPKDKKILVVNTGKLKL